MIFTSFATLSVICWILIELDNFVIVKIPKFLEVPVLAGWFIGAIGAFITLMTYTYYHLP